MDEESSPEPGEVNARPPGHIPRDSYTALRLYNSTPETIDRESRVLIVGPIPIDWLKAHREIWGKKRYALVKKLLPNNATSVVRRLRRKKVQKTAVEQINDGFMQELELAPTTTNMSESTVGKGEEGLDEQGEEQPKTLLERLELQERCESTHGVAGEEDREEGEHQNGHDDGKSLFSAPSMLHAQSPVSMSIGFEPVGMGEAGGVDTTRLLRPDITHMASYRSDGSAVESFITAQQSFGSTSQVNLMSVEEQSDEEENEHVHVMDTHSSTSTVRPASREEPSTPEPMPRDFGVDDTPVNDYEYEEPGYKRGLAKKAVRFPANVLGAGQNAAGAAFNKAGATVSAAGQRSKNLGRKGTRLVSARKFLKRRKYGEVVRLEKLLVTVKWAAQTYLPPDFNETELAETRLRERWKEYVVVARNNGVDEATGDSKIMLQFYTSRNIAQVEDQKTGAKSKLDIELNGKDFHVNFYSSLDKTIALWKSTERGTLIYIFQTKSNYSALNWLAFFSGIIGSRRENVVRLNVPDIGVALDIPFSSNQRKELMTGETSPYVEANSILSHVSSPSRLARYIFEKAFDRLYEVESLKEVIDQEWVGKVRMGLAWRRYDRIEWIFDINETQFQSSWAMASLYDLELRPKTSYTRAVNFEDGAEMEEPVPIEGFLIRLSSWTGHKKNKKMFSKRLYLHTHDNMLFFTKATKALPPQPNGGEAIDLTNDEELQRVVHQMPIIYEVAPFEVGPSGNIKWVDSDDFEKCNKAALFEMQRRVACIQRSDGFIDLTELSEVRAVSDHGMGATTDDDMNDTEGRYLELVLKDSEVVLKLRAHSQATRDQWVLSLSELMRYWKRRLREDISRTNAVRTKNLNTLQIDDDMEALIGEAVPKWETARGTADPLTYNVSGLAWSRAVHMKGFIYQKPNKFSSFEQYFAVLTHGMLILYSPYSRDSRGNREPRISYQRDQFIELKQCYVYSGLITSTDLMNRDKWFDKNNPGRHSLPRVYDDGWKSAEEETMRCFVLWFGRKRVSKNVEDEDGNLRLVNRLGVNGTSMAFVARSRQERDMWVSALGIEIGRVADEAYKDIQVV